ncbi:hypothetical protein SpCBS45565_g02606 [Spizellomyces sp. 'palustris']|nr:hypothetical protein SpCBS45565_g02606 [Spizellomyces sp. 'palustris']
MDTLDRLTADQRDKLQNFQAITNQEDLDAALAILENHGWDLQRSVHSVFEEVGTDHTPEDAPQPAPSTSTNSTTSGGLQRQTVSLWTLLTLPVTLPLRIAWAILSYAASFLPPSLRPIPRTPAAQTRRSTTPGDSKAAAARFLLDFEQTYGTQHPQFFQGTYTQALQKAKSEIRYLLVYLHSPEHDDTSGFCRQTLGSESLSPFLIQKNILVWAGDVRNSEEFQVSNILSATKYPFLAIIAPHQSSLKVVERIEGPCSPDEVIAAVTRVIEQVDPQLLSIRAERQAREQARTIREQQDEAYQASLRADQEKERRAREERERQEKEQAAAEKAEKDREARIEAKKKRKQHLTDTLPAEPDASESELSKLSIRLPSGERVVRRFRADDTMQNLYDFVETRDLLPLELDVDFVIVNTYPRKVYVNMEETLRNAGLVPNASLVVEEKIEEDE